MKGVIMNAISRVVAKVVVALGLAACNAVNGTTAVPRPAAESVTRLSSQETSKIWGPNVVAACPDVRPGEAQCLALIRAGSKSARGGGSGPNGGFTPAQLEAAYNLPSVSKGSGQIIALVDAYDDPDAASDLTYYRSYFGLPTGSFTKYNQEGQTENYPRGNTEWGVEETLDLDMVAASCPNCSIYLVEANSSSTSDLESAEAEAVTLGAQIISNSYGCVLGPSCPLTKNAYDTSGITYVAGAGDFGFTSHVMAPAAFGSVVSAGGTSLYADSKVARGYRETVWLGTGSGCSKEEKPSWQHDPGCKHRTANDISADSDPATGPAIYDTDGYNGWLVGGGTSAASPFIAGIFGLAGNASSQRGGETFWARSHEGSDDLFHITRGNNGSCSPKYLCTDGTHEYRSYGGPTGWGTPNGTGAF